MLPHQEGRPVEPLVWRSVPRGTAAIGAAPPEADEARQAQTRIAELEKELERRTREAHEAGFREGENSGKDKVRKELQPVFDNLARTIREVAEFRPALRRQAEEDVVKLSLAVARRILHREMAVEPEALRGLIEVALEKLKSQELCRVRIHSEHAGLLRACLESGGRVRVEVIADPSCERGTAIFETERGNLDASVATQLREIGQGLADRLQKQS
ncbi:MAG: FliH/SctL family protein [Acidobacteria bacterium]|nr:FliH/SctL family protein [Acidobacteriota bacterium]